jgi:hypothetical protein
MKVQSLIQKLEKLQIEHGNVDVMFEERDSCLTLVDWVEYRLVESDNEYPKDWNMPAGFKFIQLSEF